MKKKTYTVFIKNLTCKAFVGIYKNEKRTKQRVRFNVLIQADDNIKNNNTISDFVSYEDVINKIKKVLELGHVPLIENLAEQIAKECLKDNKIQTIEIKIEKLDLFKDAESVGIKILRRQKK
tara:strand:- start:155 stop:520 length:366 start_codon:yes stop_codon:yes gene_type:complete